MESISRLSSMLETARDLTLEAAKDVGPRRSTRPLAPAQVRKLLDSRHEKEVLDGLRRVVAMQYATPPQPTLTFFPAVLKTLSNPYPSTRPLVYNYLIHHAEHDPDTALLAINTIQKLLSDSNPHVRAMALKTMSSIRVPVISQIVSLAIKKGISDLSPLVRKAAALACFKCVKLDPNTRPQVETYLATLLADKQYYVAGAAVQAFMHVCPDRLDLIHPVYRNLCKMVVDMDEWGQLALLKLLTVYARKCFSRRGKRVRRAATHEQQAKRFYEDLEPEDETTGDYEDVEIADPDLELFLRSIQSLLSNRNSAVIVAVTRAYLYLAPADYLPLAIGPLIALLRSPQDIQQVALCNIVQVCLLHPTHFVAHSRHFLIRSGESPAIWQLKLEVLTLVFPHCRKDVQDLILAELEHFSKGTDPDLVRESVRAIGRCAQGSDATTSRRCLSLLLRQIHSSDQHLVGEAIEVIRHLIQRTPNEHRKTVIRLAKNLDTLVAPEARASIVWLVGEFAGHDSGSNIAADVLRILVRTYADETNKVRGQIVLLAAKVYLHHLNAQNAEQQALHASQSSRNIASPQSDELDDVTGLNSNSLHESLASPHPIELLYNHTMVLARYTPSYDLRDRARLFRSLLSTPTGGTELASLLLLAPKPVPQAPSPSETRREFTLGSASLVVGEGALRGYEAVPDWIEEGCEPDSNLREDGAVTSPQGYANRGDVSAGQRLDEALRADASYRPNGMNDGAKKQKTLDAWLDEEEEDGEGDDETGEEETESEGSDEDEEESEYETDSEEDDERAELVR